MMNEEISQNVEAYDTRTVRSNQKKLNIWRKMKNCFHLTPLKLKRRKVIKIGAKNQLGILMWTIYGKVGFEVSFEILFLS